MNRKILIASLSLLALIGTAVSAGPVPVPLKPEKCPCVCAIKAAGVTMVEQLHDGTWVAGQDKNKFDTKEEWTFGIGFFEAKDRNEALSKANEALKTLRLVAGPTAYNGKWACTYDNAQGNHAGAITPPFTDNEMSVIKAIR